MTERNRRDTTASPASTPSASAGAARLEKLALLVLLLIVAMRPLLSETYDTSLDSMSRASGAVGVPTPAMSLSFDLAIWAMGLVIAVVTLVCRRRWTWAGLLPGGIGLLAGAVISTMVAGNKRIALDASIDWLTAFLLVIVLANLCRDRRRVALVLIVLAASGLASSARSLMQMRVEYGETWEHYQANKLQFWASQGVPLEDARVTLYERRMRACEATGFFSHSNVEGAWLVLAGFASLGLVAWGKRPRWQAVVPILLAAAMFAVVPFTGSKGALAALCLSGLLGLVLWAGGERIRRHWRLLWAGLWLGALVGGATVLMYGLRTGGLPGDSLRFRWNYWEVTRHILVHQGWTGVGAMNYAAAYLAAKPPEFPEEVSDPHNFVLSIVAQWGAAGGVGLLLALIGGSFVAARRWGEAPAGAAKAGDAPAENPSVGGASVARASVGEASNSISSAAIRWTLVLAGGFLLLRLAVLQGWLQDPAGGYYVLFDVGFYGLLWVVAMAGLLWLVQPNAARDERTWQIVVACGVIAFLLQGMIDFAMFVPGSLTAFAALAGVLLARPSADAENTGTAPRRFGQVAPILVTVGGGVAVMVLGLVPVLHSGVLMKEAREFGQRAVAAGEAATSAKDQAQADALLDRAGERGDTSLEYYQEAAAADPWDPTPLFEAAEVLAGVPSPNGTLLSRAITVLNEAVLRNPRDIAVYRLRARLLMARFEQQGSAADVLGALGAGRRVLQMYPASPEEHLWFADMLTMTGLAAEDEDLRADAIKAYRDALELDNCRAVGEIRKWSPERRRQIEAKIAGLLPPDSHPATAAE